MLEHITWIYFFTVLSIAFALSIYGVIVYRKRVIKRLVTATIVCDVVVLATLYMGIHRELFYTPVYPRGLSGYSFLVEFLSHTTDPVLHVLALVFLIIYTIALLITTTSLIHGRGSEES